MGSYLADRVFSLAGFILLSIFSMALNAQTLISGNINGDTTWNIDQSPIVIQDNTTVGLQTVVTIEPGVQVLFSGPYWLKIEGTLIAQGNITEPIVFSGQDSNTVWHHIEFLPGSDASIMDYVVISKAGAVSTSSSQAYGALYIINSTPQLTHLVVKENAVTGIFAENINSDFSISNSEISRNVNTTIGGIGAGGIYIDTSGTASITISNNLLDGNRTNSHGGGIYVAGSATLLLENNQIINNRSIGAYGYGGGVYVSNLFGNSGQNIIRDNMFDNNIADRDGGGIWMDESQMTIERNVLKENAAMDSQGGALYIGDTNTQDLVKAVTIIAGNLVYANHAMESGGAFYIENGTHTISNNVLYANIADDQGGDVSNEQGGALMARDGQLDISNNIVAQNLAYNGGAISITASGNISNNSVVHNQSRQIMRIKGNVTIHGNTVAENTADTNIIFFPSQADPLPVINNNNFFNDSLAYTIDNLNASVVNAQSNWWNSTDELEIEFNLSDAIDYSQFLLEPLTDTPVTPPVISEFKHDANSITLSWEENPEVDVQGYKVYWGEDPVPDLQNVMDVGAQTSVSINNLSSGEGYYFAVTAYDGSTMLDDQNTVINENQVAGSESWYSRQYYKPKESNQDNGGGGGLSIYIELLLIIYIFKNNRRLRIKVNYS